MLAPPSDLATLKATYGSTWATIASFIGHQPERQESAAGAADPIYVEASPLTYVSPSAPPFLLIHGDQDQVIAIGQSKRLAAALQAKGVDVTLHEIVGGKHNVLDASIAQAIVGWLQTRLP